MLQNLDEWQTLETQIAACTQCALHANRVWSVFGEGPMDAEIVFVGEAPGENENDVGKPFLETATAGAVLSGLCMESGISRADMFITNTVKCWPGKGNPDPAPEEIEACDPWLQAQLNFIKPKGIITVGKYSTSKWIPLSSKLTITQVAGAIRPADLAWGRVYVMPIVHPAYLARNGAKRPGDEMFDETVEQLVTLRRIIDEQR